MADLGSPHTPTQTRDALALILGENLHVRVFREGDLEPGSDVRQVQHSNSQVYTRRPWPVAYGPRNATTVWQAGPSGKPLSWEMLTGALGGYTLTEVPSGLGGGQTKETSADE